MAEKDIIQNLIHRPGQSRTERLPQELRRDYVRVEERTPEDLLLFLKKLAARVRFYQPGIDKPKDKPTNDWTSFFPFDAKTVAELRRRAGGDTPPHLALLLAFLELYEKPKEVINRLTGRHLDYYFREILRFSKKGPVPDRAHVVLELKKGAAPFLLKPEHLFSAGKDAAGVELLYEPTLQTVINAARVAELRSLFLDSRGGGVIRYAPLARSADGLGGELPGEEPKWFAFGHRKLPPAEVGFALSSPVLRMREGSRKVTVALTLKGVDPSQRNRLTPKGAFEAYVTGEKGWLGPYDLEPAIDADNVLRFSCTISEREKAVVDYDAAVHHHYYTAAAPVLQVLFKTGQSVGYLDFRNISVEKARITVEVSGVTSLTLESDAGALDPKKAFLPFGPQPTKGSRFLAGYAEALAKKLSRVMLTVQWKDAPETFSDRYNGYAVLAGKPLDNHYFTAAASFHDGGTWEEQSSQPLFNKENAKASHNIEFTPHEKKTPPPLSEGKKIHALQMAGMRWAKAAANKALLKELAPRASQAAPPEPRPGFITFSLEQSFFHAEYRKQYVEMVVNAGKPGGGTLTLLNEPYTPAIQSIKLSYTAESDEVGIGKATLDEFANDDLQFFHLTYFGQMREHAYQRQLVLGDPKITLLPSYDFLAAPDFTGQDDAGELLLGMAHLAPGDSVSVLFQVAEGSADPDLQAADLSWFALGDNYWRPLEKSALALDTTNRLLTSGVIRFVIPAEATTNNTILPRNLVWLKGMIPRRVGAVCQLVDVAANAVEVRFTDRGNDPGHLLTALEKGKICKLKSGLAGVKNVKQPYASFGSSPGETDDAFVTRVSERLRHKDRALTAWDYERLILEAFPQVHKVKCIPHAREGVWLAPGHVLIVVVPDLKNRNAVNPLEPRVDADTLTRIRDYVRERTGMQVQVKVKNPFYQKVQLDFKVKFHEGYEFNYYRAALNQAIIRFLSPWAYEATRDIAFGGKVYKSVLLDVVEEAEHEGATYVDYVTDFKMYSYPGAGPNLLDLNEAQPGTPDTILVSAETHLIARVE